MKTLHFSMITVIGIALIGIIFFVVVLSPTQPQITISTDKKIYDNYNGIEASGFAKPMVEGRSLIFTVVEPNGTSYQPATTGNFHDGKYDIVFSIGMPHWEEKGTYKIIVNYGNMKAETSIEFSPPTHS